MCKIRLCDVLISYNAQRLHAVWKGNMKYKDEYESEIMQPIVWAEMPTKNGVVYPSYLEWLESKYAASRDSRQLSAVPSEEEIEKWYIDSYGIAKDLDGKPSWSSSIGYRTEGDLYEMLNDFCKWIKQRGIAG